MDFDVMMKEYGATEPQAPEQESQPEQPDPSTEQPQEQPTEQQEPTQEQEPSTPEPQEPSESQKPDPSTVLSELGEYESLEQVKTELQKAREYEQKLEKLQGEVGSLKKQPRITNEKYFKLDKLEQEDPTNLSAYRMAIFNPDAPDTEWAKMELVNRYPQLAKDPEKLQRKFEREYSDFFQGDEESDEYVAAKDDMELAAATAKERINKKLEEVEVPAPDSDEKASQEQMQNFVKQWEAPYNQMKQGISMEMNLPGEKDQSLAVKYDIPQEEVGKYLNLAFQTAYNQGLNDPTQENIEQVKDTARKMYIAENLDSFAKSILDQVSSKVGMDWRKAVHNPKRPSDRSEPQRQQPKTPGGLSSPDEVLGALKSRVTQ